MMNWIRNNSDKLIAALFGLMFAFIAVTLFDFGPKVAVEIFKSTETGNMIYCSSGDLHGSSGHTYMGSGTIDPAKAVSC
jgi:hypothetical protein